MFVVWALHSIIFYKYLTFTYIKTKKKRVLRFNFSFIFIINIIIHILIVRYRQWSLPHPVRPQPDPTALTIPAHCASCGRRQSVSIECVCRYRSHCRISASLICVIPWTADPCEIGATNTQHRKRDFWVFQIFGMRSSAKNNNNNKNNLKLLMENCEKLHDAGGGRECRV